MNKSEIISLFTDDENKIFSNRVSQVKTVIESNDNQKKDEEGNIKK